MRKLVIVLTVVVFTASIVACTPQSINDGTEQGLSGKDEEPER